MATMLDREKFFQRQIEECRELARHAVNKDDQEFWQQISDRWERQLREFNQAIKAQKAKDHLHNTRAVGTNGKRS